MLTRHSTGQLPLLPTNRYQFSINLSGHVANLVGFWPETPNLSWTFLSMKSLFWRYAKIRCVTCLTNTEWVYVLYTDYLPRLCIFKVFVRWIKIGFWATTRFILKQFDYLLWIPMRDSWQGCCLSQLSRDRNLELIVLLLVNTATHLNNIVCKWLESRCHGLSLNSSSVGPQCIVSMYEEQEVSG